MTICGLDNGVHFTFVKYHDRDDVTTIVLGAVMIAASSIVLAVIFLNGLHLYWLQLLEDELWAPFLGISLIALLLLAWVGRMIFDMIATLKKDKTKKEHYFIAENQMLAFYSPEGNELARATFDSITTKLYALKVKRSLIYTRLSTILFWGRYHHFPAIQIQFPDQGPTLRLALKNGTPSWKDPEIIDESVIHYQLQRWSWTYLVKAFGT